MDDDRKEKPENQFIEHGKYMLFISKLGGKYLYSRCCRTPIVEFEKQKVCGKCYKPPMELIQQENPRAKDGWAPNVDMDAIEGA